MLRFSIIKLALLHGLRLHQQQFIVLCVIRVTEILSYSLNVCRHSVWVYTFYSANLMNMSLIYRASCASMRTVTPSPPFDNILNCDMTARKLRARKLRRNIIRNVISPMCYIFWAQLTKQSMQPGWALSLSVYVF